MKEKELQEKIINKFKTNTFFDLIKNKHIVEKTLEKFSDDEMLPYLSVDYLLRLNYFKGCKIVLEGIENKEYNNELTILNGESIRNISLEDEQQLYPDLLLYNKSKGKYIIGELKRSKETERQAITELLGYELEIKNHLPLSANSDILMILISFDYSTLLQHSIESLILDSKPVMCLVPVIEDDEFQYFDIFVPDCWTNTNYPFLDEKAFQGTTYSVYNLSDQEEEKSIVDSLDMSLTAIEYVKGKCEKYKLHGFSLIWLPDDLEGERICITIFLVNPYYIFYHSSNRTAGTPITDNINENIEDYQLHAMNYDMVHFVFSEADRYLRQDMDVMIDSNMDLHSFRKYMIYKGNAVKCDCWGEFGESIRLAFLKENIRKGINPRWGDFHEPVVFFKLFDLITENYIFVSGFDNLYDYFIFGVKIGCLSNLCIYYSAIKTNDEGESVDENNIVTEKIVPLISQLKNRILWEIYKLENSLQEIQMRYDLDLEMKRFDVSDKKCFDELSQYMLDFMVKFKKHINEKCRLIMDMGYQNGAFFDDFFWKMTGLEQQNFFKSNIINTIYPVFCEGLRELIDLQDISIDSELFQILIELSEIFPVSFTGGREGAHQLCKEYAAIPAKQFNETMDGLEKDLKARLVKKYFKYVLMQSKSFEVRSEYISTMDLLKKFDMDFLLKCVTQERNKQNRICIYIKDNDSPAIVQAVDGTVLAKEIDLAPKEKIAVYREYGGIELIEFIDLQELSSYFSG
ncbi:hypothetical protein [Parablautia intestinalis]|uniref:hypothetical protein n=1 Tax=Parablautia intestinalis TaxID=2320100 RepID=UPI00256F181A|nr:hypothetical protein [Parablautia intestinalis]